MSTAGETSTISREGRQRSGWLFGPGLDLLFLANVTWPMIFLVQWWGGLHAHEGVRFWQVYFVTTAHRYARPESRFALSPVVQPAVNDRFFARCSK